MLVDTLKFHCFPFFVHFSSNFGQLGGKKGDNDRKAAKKEILTIKWRAKQPLTGQNTQQLISTIKVFSSSSFLLEKCLPKTKIVVLILVNLTLGHKGIQLYPVVRLCR